MELKATKKTRLETEEGMPSLTQPMTVMVVTMTIPKNKKQKNTAVEKVN